MLSKITVAAAAIVLFSACGSGDNRNGSNKSDTLTEEQRHLPENALKSLTVAEGLEVQLMAHEPVVRNPTNIDVDDRGRVWVTEAFNYRPFRNTTVAPGGDRIMIFEDKDGDGILETNTVFYQGPEINAPLGICILEDKVLIAQSPYVWAFYDDNKDDKADRKEIIFQGISGVQHDHGMHTFVAGPDGKLYFNFGNEGKSLRDKNNKVVLDQYGDSIGSPKYKQGMVFRCDPDGSNVERLGDNFRNNYEVAVDSYGTIWQSDNDDDGNRGVRINYVMEYGNFGYTDEMTGEGWSSNRINIEDSIPFRHWHLNDPGVVPNLLQTGSGSPTGIIFYEGDLLPEKFQNQIIHCETGHNVVRAYPAKKDGAGYSASIENILNGETDQWFRPSDVCVAPDGSLIIADWYDPVVGGHAAMDKESGRIFRVAPKGAAYKIPVFDYNTPEGVVKALQNPNHFVRRKAIVAIHSMGEKAVPALEELWKSSANSRMRARAFWALVKLPGGEKYIASAIKETDPDLRIVGLRAARQLNNNVIDVISQLVNDKDPQVRRECALALHKNKAPQAPALWAELAGSHDGRDRWYLEALGIGGADQWDSFFGAYLKKVPDPLQTAAGRDIVWRSRSNISLPYLAKLAGDESADLKSRLRYFRAFDFNKGPAKTKILLQMLSDNKSNSRELNVVLFQVLTPAEVKNSAIAKQALNKVLAEEYGNKSYITLVDRYQVKSEKSRLLQLALDKPGDDLAPEAISLLVDLGGKDMLNGVLKEKDPEKISDLITALSSIGNGQSLEVIKTVLTGENYPENLRVHAAKMMGKSWWGGDWIFNLLKAHELPEHLVEPSLDGLKAGPRNDLFVSINKILSDKDKTITPFNKDSVLALKGDVSKGVTVYKTNCAICHQVKGEGTDFGPKLTEIGSKLPKEGILEAIIEPSSGISFGYETTELNLKDGSTLKGLLTENSETEIGMKYPGGTSGKIKTSNIKTMKKLEESLMPDMHELISKQELADLLAYLSSLKK